MLKIKPFLLGSICVFLCSVAFAVPVSYKEIPEIKQVTMQWKLAVDERNPEKIVNLYDEKAFLYATFSNVIEDRAGMMSYFTKLGKHPNLKVVFTRENIRVYGDVAVNSGLYVFSYVDKGKTVKIPGRYTFVYHNTPKGWMIIDHHSSVLPEKDKK